MSYMHMPYPGHQLLPQLRTFLLDTYMRYGRLRNWEPRRLLGHVYHRHPAEAGTTLAHLQADWHIWYDANQEIVGAVLCEDAAHQYIQTHPDHHVLVAEMVAWVTSQGAAHPPSIWCHDDDVHLQQLLVARGYQQEPAHMLQKYCDLRQQHFVPSPLPTGYRIGTMDRTARRGAQMAALLNQAFGRTTHSAAEYANFQQLMPDYRETSDWIVLSPTDDVVCSVGMTWYPEAQLVIIEPVATHPAHQGRGLARTAITHGLHVAQQAGLMDAWVEAWHANAVADHTYTRAGCQTVARHYCWQKQ